MEIELDARRVSELGARRIFELDCWEIDRCLPPFSPATRAAFNSPSPPARKGLPESSPNLFQAPEPLPAAGIGFTGRQTGLGRKAAPLKGNHE